MKFQVFKQSKSWNDFISRSLVDIINKEQKEYFFNPIIEEKWYKLKKPGTYICYIRKISSRFPKFLPGYEILFFWVYF